MGELLTPDLCVIGAGSGGLSIAAGAAQMGASVVLLEGHRMGGDCLNYGCVPSKAMLAAAKHAHAFRSSAAFGIAKAEPQIDFAAVKDHVAAVIAGIAPHDSVERFEGLGVRVITEYGRFVSSEEVEAGEARVRARRFVIATGSSPLIPPIPGLEDGPYLTNETIFADRQRPRHLLIIGGGPIGMEMAQAHVRLGCLVTVIEGDRLLGKDDPDAAALVIETLRAEGVELAEDAMAERIEHSEGSVTVRAKDGRSWTGSHLLVAVGRKVNLERLNLSAAGIEHDRAVKVDGGLRSSNRRVYAIGDAAGGMQFTHVANYHAGLVVRSALFRLPVKAKTAHIPWTTYTDPELAQVGLTEAQAREAHGDGVEIVRFEMAEVDRARAERAPAGFIKVAVRRGRPLGATIVGRQAGELIGVWALAISAGLKMSDLAGMVAPYPTLGEISKRAAGQYFAPRLFGNDWVRRAVGALSRLG